MASAHFSAGELAVTLAGGPARIVHYPIERRERVTPRAPFELAGVVFEAFQVEHSLRAPAVGDRIGCGGAVVFYAPDLVAIPEQDEALRGIRIYIGDGAASLARSSGDGTASASGMRRSASSWTGVQWKA